MRYPRRRLAAFIDDLITLVCVRVQDAAKPIQSTLGVAKISAKTFFFRITHKIAYK